MTTDRTYGPNVTDGDGPSAAGGRNGGPDRVVAARELLSDEGIDAPVRALGTDGEIAAVTGPEALREPLARLAPELRSLGFRYVALELGSGDE